MFKTEGQGRRRKLSNKQKQQRTAWTGVSKLVYQLKRQVLLIKEYTGEKSSMFWLGVKFSLPANINSIVIT